MKICWVYCKDCPHKAKITDADIVAKIRTAKFKCSSCGSTAKPQIDVMWSQG